MQHSAYSLYRLHTITNRILDAEKNNYQELFSACNELYTTLLELTFTDPDERENRESIFLEKGKAIGLSWAAMCIKEIIRTKRFIDGVEEAVSEASRKNPGRAVHVLYAGTGPFATLVLPLTARFSSTQLQFTFLDVNEICLEKLLQLFGNLHLENYIHRTVKADATEWIIPAGEHYDVFISETMNTALKTEPQAAIYLNIIPQLSPATIIIPEEITLQAAQINSRIRTQKQSADAITVLGTVFTLNRETALQYAGTPKRSYNTRLSFPAKEFHLTPASSAGADDLHILTAITVYKEQKLLIDECSLTMTHKLVDFEKQQPSRVKLYYEINSKPGVRMTFPENENYIH